MMVEPRPEDVDRSLIVAAYRAREALAMAAREAGNTPTSVQTRKASYHLNEGLVFLRACRVLIADAATGHPVYQALVLTDRAIASVQSAIATGDVTATYWSEPQKTDFEGKQRQRTQRRWQMATEGARQDAHRVLAELAEVYPDAYDVEEL
jgi:hypothetical protein